MLTFLPYEVRPIFDPSIRCEASRRDRVKYLRFVQKIRSISFLVVVGEEVPRTLGILTMRYTSSYLGIDA